MELRVGLNVHIVMELWILKMHTVSIAEQFWSMREVNKMDDLIYRQAAIDALGFGNEWEVMDFTVIDKDDAIHQIKALPSAQQWIPCSERLPRTKDDYIITVKDKYGTWTDYVEWSADYHWWGYDDDMVIAWMPLPEPYKGKEASLQNERRQRL